VHRVRVRVVGIFVKALRERFQAAALCLEVRRVLIARTREANVAGWREAERVQVSLIKQEEVGEPLAARHILANVVPVVKAHRPQAFSSVPQRLVHFRLYCRHPPRVREGIGTILYHESVTEENACGRWAFTTGPTFARICRAATGSPSSSCIIRAT